MKSETKIRKHCTVDLKPQNSNLNPKFPLLKPYTLNPLSLDPTH